MLHPIDEIAVARARFEKMRQDADDRRLVQMSKRARYARSGNGYRFIAAGQSLFERTPDPIKAA